MNASNRFKKQITQFFGVPVVVFLIFCLPTVLLAQPWQDSIGYTQLLAEYGSVEDGTGITLSMAEADFNANVTLFRYLPDPADANLAGKNIIDGSGLNNDGFSGHATAQARNIFGGVSIAQGETDMTVFEANDYIERVLGLGTALEPIAQTAKVQNHSWIGNFTNDAPGIAAAEESLRRQDYVINRDQMSVVVGINNNSNNAQPMLLGQAYNVISVGRVDGNHSRGTSTLYGAGRVIPSIVTAQATTSAATSRTSSVLAVLHHKAVNEGNADASRPEMMKAIVMAGATKDNLPLGWSRTITRPLDSVYGAGELNIYNSYKILEGGETDGSLSVPAGGTIDKAGWDFGESIDPGADQYYNIEIFGNQEYRDVSILLTWNMDVVDDDPGAGFNPAADPVTDLADMSLRLYDSTGSPLGSLLDSSLSTVDNVEHIFLTSLGPGLYTIEVSTDLTTDFGLAWFATAVPEPGSLLVLALGSVLFTMTGRRRR